MDWVLFNERYGVPMPLGTYNDATPPEEKAALVEALTKIGEDFIAAFHESCKITSLDVSANGTPDSVQGAMIALVDAQISKLFTGATLTSGEGTSAGSYALGRVHENVLFQFTAGDAERLPQVFEHQIGTPFVAWNGLRGRPPKLKIHVVKEVDPVARMGIFSAALQMGLELDADQVRTEMQLKPATGEAIGSAPPQGTAPPPTERRDEGEEEETEDDEEGAAAEDAA
jgi:phage gp29-like protein